MDFCCCIQQPEKNDEEMGKFKIKEWEKEKVNTEKKYRRNLVNQKLYKRNSLKLCHEIRNLKKIRFTYTFNRGVLFIYRKFI